MAAPETVPLDSEPSLITGMKRKYSSGNIASFLHRKCHATFKCAKIRKKISKSKPEPHHASEDTPDDPPPVRS